MEHEKPSQDELITPGKKRTRLDSRSPQTLSTTPCNDKKRDIGWEHGTSFNNNPYQWKCNWCGLMRYGGGVSMLKRHLAGLPPVKKCQNVPEEVVKSILDQLHQKQKSREKKSGSRSTVGATDFTSFSDLEADQPKKCDLETQLSGSMKVSEGAALMTRDETQKPKTAADSTNAFAQQSDDLIEEHMNDGHACAPFSQNNNQDLHDKMNYQQTNVLENMSRFIKISEDGGVQVCFSDALAYGTSSFAEELKKSGSVDTTQVEGSQGTGSDCFNGQGQQQNLDASENTAQCSSRHEPESYHRKDANINTTNSQKFFLDILCSDKFALLCDLIYENFLEGKVKSLFDLTAINAKLKNAEYDRSPASFYQDMQQVWNKFQKLGEEMVFLASSLLNMSQTLCQKLVGENLADKANEQEPEDTCHRSANTQFTPELDLSTKPDETLVSGFPVACMCKQCETETSKGASLICSGCEAAYCFACIKFNVKDIPTQGWLCVSCRVGNRDLLEPVLDHPQGGFLQQGCIGCDSLEISATKNDMNRNKSNPLLAMVSRDSSEAVKVGHESCVGCNNLEISVMQNDINENRNNSSLAMDSMVLSKPRDDLNGNKNKLLAIYSRNNLHSSTELETEESALSQAANLLMCKLCGVCEDGGKFLAPGQVRRPYNFYHLKCLKGQIASTMHKNKQFWSCSSCLCRACLSNNDDELTVLCDIREPPLLSESEDHVSCNVVEET